MERAHDGVFGADTGLVSLVPAGGSMSPLTVSMEGCGDGLNCNSDLVSKDEVDKRLKELTSEGACGGVLVAPTSVMPVAVGVFLGAFLAWFVLRRLAGNLGVVVAVDRSMVERISSKLVGRSSGGNSASKTHAASGTIEGGHNNLTSGVVDLLLVLVVMGLLDSKVVVGRDSRCVGVNHILVGGKVTVSMDGRLVGVDDGLLSSKVVIDRSGGLVGISHGPAWSEGVDNRVQGRSLSRGRPNKEVSIRESNKAPDDDLLASVLRYARHDADTWVSNLRVLASRAIMGWFGIDDAVDGVSDLDPAHGLT